PGLLPLAGCLPLAPALDRCGIFAASVRDCGAALGALGGLEPPPLEPARGRLRVGLLEESFASDPSVERACRSALEAWQARGAELGPVDLGWDGRGLGKVYAFDLAQQWGASVGAEPAL